MLSLTAKVLLQQVAAAHFNADHGHGGPVEFGRQRRTGDQTQGQRRRQQPLQLQHSHRTPWQHGRNDTVYQGADDRGGTPRRDGLLPTVAPTAPVAPTRPPLRHRTPGRPVSSPAMATCARICAGAIEAHIDWPNSGTHCEGESRDKPPGIRLSFQRVPRGAPNLLFVFGITGIRPGKPAHAAGVNLTVIVQGSESNLRHAGRLALHGGLADAAAARGKGLVPGRGPWLLHAAGACGARRRRLAGEHLRVRRLRNLL